MFLTSNYPDMRYTSLIRRLSIHGTDLMQLHNFARVRAQGHASLSGITLDLERYHT